MKKDDKQDAYPTYADIAEQGYVLTPGRYVGAEEVEDDAEPFEEKMQRLVSELNRSSPNPPSWKPLSART